MNNSERLTTILKHSVDNSKYYRDLNIKDYFIDITCFPILTKKLIFDYKNDIIIDEYKNTLLKECSVHLSSGTVGKPIEVYWHYNDEMLSNLSLWRLRAKFHDIKPSNRLCTLHTTNYSWNRISDYKKIVYSKDQKTLSLCKLFFDDENLLQYYNEIMKFQPEWMFFQPSNFVKLTEFMIRNNLKKPDSIRYIEFTGEVLLSEAVKLVKEFYNCDYSNMYGTTETNGIAYTCPYGQMHVLKDNVFLEVDQGDHGKVRVTSLTNRVFPLIRYEVGDMLKLNKCKHCMCGQSGTVIEEISGRQQNIVQFQDGNTISEAVIMSIMDRVNSLTGNVIREYKAQLSLKEGTTNFLLYIDSKHKARQHVVEEEFHKVMSIFFNFIDGITVSFVYEPIKIQENGKFAILEVIK